MITCILNSAAVGRAAYRVIQRSGDSLQHGSLRPAGRVRRMCRKEHHTPRAPGNLLMLLVAGAETFRWLCHNLMWGLGYLTGYASIGFANGMWVCLRNRVDSVSWLVVLDMQHRAKLELRACTYSKPQRFRAEQMPHSRRSTPLMHQVQHALQACVTTRILHHVCILQRAQGANCCCCRWQHPASNIA